MLHNASLETLSFSRYASPSLVQGVKRPKHCRLVARKIGVEDDRPGRHVRSASSDVGPADLQALGRHSIGIVSDKSCGRNQNTHFVFNNFFFQKIVPFMI
jgi:hypothetical protein